MEWTYLFDRTILGRGRRYYSGGYVRNLKKQGDQYRATVIGTRTYRVTITLKGAHVSSMRCTCPYAEDGSKCKHMAAVLYKIEKEYGDALEKEAADGSDSAELSDVVVTKEDDAFPENYTYFDSKAMKEEMDCKVSMWRSAVKLARAGKVVMDSVSTGYENDYFTGEREMRGTILGHAGSGQARAAVQISFNRKHIIKGQCEVRGCKSTYDANMYYGRSEFCVHQWALFFHLKEYLKQNPLGDATDWSSSQFLNQCRTVRPMSASSRSLMMSAEKFELEPRLQIEPYEWSLSFRIGGTKKYVVKNLTSLVSCSEKKEVMTFGSATVWNMSPENFSEQGQKYLNFIREIVSGERMRALRFSRDYYDFQENYVEVKGSIPLFGRALDDFFELHRPAALEYLDKSGSEKKTGSLILEDKLPVLSLTIERTEDDRGFFQGIRISGKLPEIIRGQKAFYYIDDGLLCRMDSEHARQMDPLLQQETNGALNLLIGRNRLRDFYYTALPWLREHAEIIEKDGEEIRSYLPPEAKLVFYLDSENSDISCRAEAMYGDRHVSVMDTARPDFSSHLFAGDFPRDTEKETDAAKLVLEFFPHVSEEPAVCCCDGDEQEIYRVLDEGIDELALFGEVQATDRFRRLNLRRAPKLSVGVSIESQLLNLSIVSEDIPQEELLGVLDSYRKKKKFYRMKNGGFLKLEGESIELLEQLMTSLRLSPKEFTSGKMHVPVYRALYLEKMLEKNESLYVKRDRHFKSLVKDFKTIEDSDHEVPEELQSVLRPYQVTGYQWLKTLDAYGFGGILADEMGLGKTLQVITVLLSEKERLGENPALIVAPASLVYNWADELKRFAPRLQVCMITGSQKERAEKISHRGEAEVLVTSYDLLKRDIAEYEGIQFAYEIIDEAQYIKNHTTAAAKAVKIIKSRMRYALTGTPIENRLSELWSIFDYLMPGYLYSYEVFRKEIETPIVKNAEQPVSLRLKKMVSPFILRRRKTDVLKDLPDKLEEIRFAKFDGAQQKLYDGQVLNMKSMLEKQDEEDFQKNKIRILAELTRLRQICCDPSLCFEQYSDGSAKREACLELIQSAIEGEHKMLVFSQFTSMLKLLEADLAASGIEYYKITGNTPKEERLRLVKAFNEDQTPVFLISLKAGGTGLNLIGADVVIHYDPWWNLAVQNQATDRAHRIGQKKVVTVFKLIAKDSIEENILKMQNDKKDLADAILEGENGGIGKMSREELMELIGK